MMIEIIKYEPHPFGSKVLISVQLLLLITKYSDSRISYVVFSISFFFVKDMVNTGQASQVNNLKIIL